MQGQGWPRALSQITGTGAQTLPPQACVRESPGFISPGCGLVPLLSDVEQRGITHPSPPAMKLGTWLGQRGSPPFTRSVFLKSGCRRACVVGTSPQEPGIMEMVRDSELKCLPRVLAPLYPDLKQVV